MYDVKAEGVLSRASMMTLLEHDLFLTSEKSATEVLDELFPTLAVGAIENCY